METSAEARRRDDLRRVARQVGAGSGRQVDARTVTFVRHYEDAARIIVAEGTIPPMPEYADVLALAADMLSQAPRQLAGRPIATDPAFTPADTPRWTEIANAHEAIGPMFWGPRIALHEACAAIRTWIAERFSG